MKINSIMHQLRKKYCGFFPKHLIVDSGKSKLSAITFDDGPCPGNTEKILDVLEQYGVKATFFMSGEEAEKYPELINQIYQQGHQLANHGYFHKTINELGSKYYIDGVNKAHEILESGANTKLKKVFRPPYGEMNFAVARLLVKQGYQFALWSYDTRDSYLDSADEIVNHMQSDIPRQQEIFLMHDDYERISLALPTMLDFLIDNGHAFGRLDQLSNG